jgi:hypothetical protein
MYEYKIAELFAKLAKKYFKVFSSCNNNFKINTSPQPSPTGEGVRQKIWCNNCSKCAFVYSVLS